MSETMSEYVRIMFSGEDHSKKVIDVFCVPACLFVYVLVAKEAKSQTDVLTCLKVQSSSIGFLENCGCVSVLRCPVLVRYVSLGHCELFYLVQADRSCPSSSLHCSDGLRGQPSEMRSPLQIATFFAKRKS